jgi:hypothetical protein
MTDRSISDHAQKRLTSLKTKIIRLIPGYGHYRIEEDLREWDRAVRDQALISLKEAEKAVESVFQYYVPSRDLGRIRLLEESRKDIRSTKETIRTSAYGFWPSFSGLKINEKALVNVLDIDESILSESRKLADDLLQGAKYLVSVQSEEDRTAKLTEFVSAVQEILGNVADLISKRSQLLRTGILGT